MDDFKEKLEKAIENENNEEINVFIKKNIIDLKNNIKKKTVHYFFIPQHKYLLHNKEILRFENLDNDFKNLFYKPLVKLCIIIA